LDIPYSFGIYLSSLFSFLGPAHGKRDEDVKALLRLDRIDAIRKALTTVGNGANSKAKAAETAAQTARNYFAQGLGVSSTTADTILPIVNKHRKLLKLAEISELTTQTNLKEGLSEGGAPKSTVPRDIALKETQALLDGLESENANQSYHATMPRRL